MFNFFKIIFFIYFICYTTLLYSQEVKQISDDHLFMNNDLFKLSPQEKINRYTDLYYDYFFKDESKAMHYNNEIYRISKKFNLKTGIGDYYLNTAYINFSKSKFRKAILNSKKASEYYLKDKNYDDFLIAISRRCMYLYNSNQQKQSLFLAINKIKEYNKFKQLAGLGELYFFVSEFYFDKKKFNKSIGYAKSALYIFQRAKHYNGIAECNSLIGEIQYELENYNESIKYINRIHELPDGLKNNLAHQLVYNALMAKNYIKINKFNESIHFSDKAIKLLENVDFGLIAIEVKLTKADALQKNGKNKTALGILLKLEKEILNYLTEPDVELSLKYINLIKSNIYSANRQYDLSILELKKNLIYDKIDIDTYKNISILQYKLNNFKEAYYYYQVYHTKIINQLKENQENHLDELYIQYNVKGKEFKIQNLKIKRLKNEIELKEQREFISTLISITIILVIILCFLYYIYRIRNKVSQILKYKNNKLEVSNTNLINSNKEKEILLKEIHHRVKNNLQLVISMINIQSKMYEIDEFIELSSNRIQSMLLIHQTLYQGDSLVSIDFKNYVTLLTTSILEIFEKENLIEININIENIQFNTSTTIPLGLIVNEIVSNALKHAFPNNKSGIIKISIEHKNENYFELIIEDNGIGFSSDHLDKKSFGLELINLLSYQMHGKLTIDSSPNNSTKYTIDFKEIYD